MSNVNNVGARAADRASVADMLREYVASGRTVAVAKPRKRCPKYLRYSPHTANGKNHAPSFNPMKHAV